MRVRLVGWMLLVSVAGAAIGGGWAWAAEVDGPEIVGVRVGFDGRYRLGVWTPVEVRLRGVRGACNASVSIDVPDGDGVGVRYSTNPSEPTALRPGEEASVRLYAKFGRPAAKIAVEVHDDGRVLAAGHFSAGAVEKESRFAAGLDRQRLFVVLGPVEAVDGAVRWQGMDPDARPVVVGMSDVARLPDCWYGYEGVDAVFLLLNNSDQVDALLAKPAQAKALVDWVRLGGRVIVAAGEAAPRLGGKESPLAALLPGVVEGVVPLRQTVALEGYCRSTAPMVSGAAAEAIAAAQLVDIRGVVEAREATLPLVIRAPLGFGQVTFFAADLTRAPFSAWRDRPALVARLAGMAAVEGETLRRSGGGLHYGYRDLAGQLRSALDVFDEVGIVPFWIITAAACVYLALIGPIDYFVLRRSGWRMTWTWLSFLGVVLLASGAVAVVGRWTKSDAVCANQAELIDIDVASGQVRGTVWFNLYSPEATRYDIGLDPAERLAAGERTLLGWQGLSGDALGGMTAVGPAYDPAGGAAGYAMAPSLDEIKGVPLEVCSSRSFVAQWTASATATLEGQLREQARLPIGAVTNRLPVPLTDAMLVYDRWAYDLGTLQPGDSATLDTLTKRSELTTILTGRRLVADEKDRFRQEATPYDQTSRDVAYVLRAMMFHEAAGGQRYAGLDCDLQSSVDLSDLLPAGRAVLVARVDAQRLQDLASSIAIDGRPLVTNVKRTLFLRFVIPVERPR